MVFTVDLKLTWHNQAAGASGTGHVLPCTNVHSLSACALEKHWKSIEVITWSGLKIQDPNYGHVQGEEDEDDCET